MSDFDPIDPFSPELTDLLTQWYEAKAEADKWSAKEVSLRLRIFGGLFAEPVPGKDNKVRLPHGMALIGDYRLNYKIDEGVMNASRSLIDPADFEAVIGFRANVRDAAFRKLPDERRNLFTPFITVSPGTPGIELKPADKVRWK